MLILRKFVIVAAVLLIFVPLVMAGGSTVRQVSFANIDQLEAQEKVLKTQALALKRLEFELFAKQKIKEMNKTHLFSSARKKIIKLADGTYLARYHQIDDSTLDVEVSRSKSGSLPYVGVLAYREQVFEATVKTLDQLAPDSFALVKIIPNRHIFSYQKGSWK